MKKSFLSIILIVILASCSNSVKNSEESVQSEKIKESKLSYFINNLKTNIKLNNTYYLKENMKSTIVNNYIYEEIKNIDFSKMDVFFSNAKYKSNKAEAIVAFNFQDRTEYFDVSFLFENDKWKVLSLKERR